ncbi:MAG: hypothetical protein AAF670_06270 [Planctomycetota bacterium]
MLRQLERLAMAVVVLATLALLITSIPWTRGEELHGMWLMAHMGASGLFVVGLPLQAVLFIALQRAIPTLHELEKTLIHSLFVLGLLTIGTMFACMLPIAATDQLRTLIQLHGWIGISVVVLLVVIVVVRLTTRPRIIRKWRDLRQSG